MSQIELRQYYTPLVEHYLRLGVRSPVIQDMVSKSWKSLTLRWLNTISESDLSFLQSVFKYENFKYENHTTREGLLSLPGDYGLNRKRLYALEKEFATYTGLI